MVIDSNWQVGRRIVELGVLAEKMYCCRCNVPLHLHDTLHERTTGFGSYLQIICTNQECRTVTDVPTGKVGPTGSFDISANIVIGMIHAGLGYAQIRNFLTECNLPVMSKSCFQKHEKKIGKIFVSAAEESCKNAQQLEKEISADKELELEVSFDAGWQKRGSGFNYNNLTGHASTIGKQTGKVTCYDIRSKSCKFCEHHEGKKEAVPSHDCCRNWYGSSKSMKPDMAVSMAHKINDNECAIDVIHPDNDSTTMLKLKLDFENLKKKDDQNHTTKGITKSLIELSKRHKELKPGEVIPYLNRCFMYAITQNSSSELQIDEGLSRIVPHVFGDHGVYKSLPNGKPLISEDLRRDLENLIEKYKSKASSLRNLGSAQANESFNHSVATKAPKSKHYGGSQSLASIVSSAVLQKNEGYNYLEQMNEAALLSPGEYTKSIAKKLDTEKLKRRIKRQSLNFKPYSVGDAVWLNDPKRKVGISPKLQCNWDGPYLIINSISDLVYRIQKSESSKPRVIHYNRLHPYHGDFDNWLIKTVIQKDTESHATAIEENNIESDIELSENEQCDMSNFPTDNIEYVTVADIV
ncbi:unnamed protein product [Mytilus coruscus]|uniref:Integrase zinc-binding domain-containing protein n=1 Tax=Mytilus coruscus TaxID=42192 RepID=A0A6J8ESG2_MYTCO|nr:unnamed protein product [Mytilus coruscus]